MRFGYDIAGKPMEKELDWRMKGMKKSDILLRLYKITLAFDLES